MKQYYITPYGTIIDETNVVIPLIETESLFIEYQNWLDIKDGREVLQTTYVTAEELEEIRKSLVPQEISKRQFMWALWKMRALQPEAIDAFIDTLEGNEGIEVRISWKGATSIRRDDEMVIGFAPLFNLNSLQLDELFTSGNIFI